MQLRNVLESNRDSQPSGWTRLVVSKTPSFVGAVCRARDLITELQIQDPAEIVIEKIAAYKGAPVRYAPLARIMRESPRTHTSRPTYSGGTE